MSETRQITAWHPRQYEHRVTETVPADEATAVLGALAKLGMSVSLTTGSDQ